MGISCYYYLTFLPQTNERNDLHKLKNDYGSPNPILYEHVHRQVNPQIGENPQRYEVLERSIWKKKTKCHVFILLFIIFIYDRTFPLSASKC